MKVIKSKFFIVFLLASLILIIAFIILKNIDSKTSAQTNSNSIENLSNKKIGWGIKRNDNHEQPDLGSENKRIIEKYNGICLGNKEKKEVFLTFDEGYEAGYTENILNVLKENNVKAAFFITGHYLNTNSDLVKRMIDEGHIVGNHTVKHKSMPDISNDEIKKEVMDLHTAVYEKFGYEMRYIRPPKGEYSQRTIAYTNTLGYRTVMWSFAYDDWDEKKQGKKEYARQKILNNLHNGEVMLLHATSKDNSEILDEMIKKIKQESYEFKSLDEFYN